MAENKKDFLSIIVATIAIVIIIALVFLFYYFSAKNVSLTGIKTASVSETLNNLPKKPNVIPTNVISFKPSEVLPKEIKSGNCWVNSIAQPFREDAFRCMVDNAIYDPCFQASTGSFVFCQMNPLAPEAFLINLTKPLPKADVPQNKQSNWAWFVKLRDGTYCSPFTGTRPFFGTGPNAQIAYYGCNSNDKTEQVVLMGDLAESNVWTADKAILAQEGKNWVVKSLEKVEIDTVWQ
jgi:hypothetical protein